MILLLTIRALKRCNLGGSHINLQLSYFYSAQSNGRKWKTALARTINWIFHLYHWQSACLIKVLSMCKRIGVLRKIVVLVLAVCVCVCVALMSGTLKVLWWCCDNYIFGYLLMLLLLIFMCFLCVLPLQFLIMGWIKYSILYISYNRGCKHFLEFAYSKGSLERKKNVYKSTTKHDAQDTGNGFFFL